jgi:hypothetical protein
MSDILQKQIEKIVNLKGYEYRLWHYQASLSVLTVRAYQPANPGHNLHIVFQTVVYIQMPTSWKAGDFRLGTPDERRKIATRVGFSELKAGHVTLFAADLPDTQVYVLCHSASIERDVPPLY